MLAVLRRELLPIARNALAVAVLFFAGSYLIRDKFTAAAVILPPSEQSDLGSLLSGLAGSPALSRAFGFDSQSKLDLYLGVLQSRNVQDRLIARFGLMKHYRLKDIEKTERKLKSRTAITTTNENFVRIAVTDEDRKLAADMANAYASELDHFLQVNTNTAARKRREYLDQRLDDARRLLESAENGLRDFQVSQKLPAMRPDDAADGLGSLLGEKTRREIELGTLESVSHGPSPRAEQLREELRQVNKQIERIPPASTAIGRLAREVKIQEKILLVLTEERESARLMELRNVTTVELVDAAQPPIRKSAPKRTWVALAAFLLAFAGNCVLAWARAGVRLSE
jgi:tyrosine-protein kinase Etk/Wzc